MNQQQLNDFVREWVAQRDLPADLENRTFTLAEFETESDCQFFYPGRAHIAHKAFTSALVSLIRARNGRAEKVTITPEHYQTWLLAEHLDDIEENRGRFIESRYRVLPI